MEYKEVEVADGVTIRVPLNLTPEQEAQYIANMIAFVDFDKLKAECAEMWRLWEEGKMIPFEDVLAELNGSCGEKST